VAKIFSPFTTTYQSPDYAASCALVSGSTGAAVKAKWHVLEMASLSFPMASMMIKERFNKFCCAVVLYCMFHHSLLVNYYKILHFFCFVVMWQSLLKLKTLVSGKHFITSLASDHSNLQIEKTLLFTGQFSASSRSKLLLKKNQSLQLLRLQDVAD
jgi:hypothetical protein